jgi:hypothetical protein
MILAAAFKILICSIHVFCFHEDSFRISETPNPRTTQPHLHPYLHQLKRGSRPSCAQSHPNVDLFRKHKSHFLVFKRSRKQQERSHYLPILSKQVHCRRIGQHHRALSNFSHDRNRDRILALTGQYLHQLSVNLVLAVPQPLQSSLPQ